MERKRSIKRVNVDTPTIKISKGECPICFQIPSAHIFQCVNGHSICEKCSALVTVCPMCQSGGIRIRNLLAESLLDDIQFKCSWSQRGCDETMTRSELSSHEDQCDQNPDIINFCSKFQEARNCQHKFTSKWLSEPKNCTKFKNHVIRCLNCLSFKNEQYGVPIKVFLDFKDMTSRKFNPSRLAHHNYSPFFFRFPSPNQIGKVQLLALFFLLKFDAVRNQTLSFAFVQLTPEMSQMTVKIRIDGNPSSAMVSQFGQNSLPSQSWTQKPMSFNQFLEMVDTSSNGSETDIPFPFTLPVSFLSENYSNADKNLDVECTVQLAA